MPKSPRVKGSGIVLMLTCPLISPGGLASVWMLIYHSPDSSWLSCFSDTRSALDSVLSTLGAGSREKGEKTLLY